MGRGKGSQSIRCSTSTHRREDTKHNRRKVTVGGRYNPSLLSSLTPPPCHLLLPSSISHPTTPNSFTAYNPPSLHLPLHQPASPLVSLPTLCFFSFFFHGVVLASLSCKVFQCLCSCCFWLVCDGCFSAMSVFAWLFEALGCWFHGGWWLAG